MDGQADVEVQLLGALVLRVAGEVRTPSAALPQRLLALLAVRPGRAVGARQLVDELWDDPPDTAPNALQVYVSALRRAGGRGLVVRETAGYRLAVPACAVDLLAWEDAENPGTDLPDLAPLCQDLPAVVARHQRAVERHVGRREHAYAHDLERGETGRVLAEVPDLLQRYPLRERLHELLLRAQQLAGRRDEALAGYRRARDLLSRELGLEPSAALQDLHRRLLDGTPLPAPAPATQLPVVATPFHGRARESAELRRLLLDEQVRAVTVVGPGGVGKTRLALHVLDDDDDVLPAGGAAWVDLTAVRPGGVVAAVLRVLDVPGAGDPTVEALVRAVSGQERLLVLDGGEHLPELAGLVDEVVRATGVRLLVTSRAPLHAAAERVLLLEPLAVRDSAAAVDLVTARVLQAGGRADDLDGVEQLVDLVEGLPLALEIAAVHVPGRGCALLLEDLRRCLVDLPGDPALPARQRTLRATLEHTLSLLGPSQQDLAVLLALLDADVPLDLAERACAAVGLPVAEALHPLLELHLLRPALTPDQRGAGPAWALPGPARAALLARAEDRHRDLALDLLAEHLLALTAENAPGWPFQPGEARGHVRWRAHSELLVRGLTDPELAGRRPDVVLRLLVRATSFLLDEGEAATLAAAHGRGLADGGLTERERLLVQVSRADVARFVDDPALDDAPALADLAHAAQVHGLSDLAVALDSWSLSGQADGAEIAAFQDRVATDTPPSSVARVLCLHNLASALLIAGRPAVAEDCARAAVAAAEGAGQDRLALEALGTAADAAALHGDPAAALRWARRADAVAQGFGGPPAAAARARLGHALSAHGSPRGLDLQLDALVVLWRSGADHEAALVAARAARSAGAPPSTVAVLLAVAEELLQTQDPDLRLLVAQWVQPVAPPREAERRAAALAVAERTDLAALVQALER